MFRPTRRQWSTEKPLLQLDATGIRKAAFKAAAVRYTNRVAVALMTATAGVASRGGCGTAYNIEGGDTMRSAERSRCRSGCRSPIQLFDSNTQSSAQWWQLRIAPCMRVLYLKVARVSILRDQKLANL